MNPSPSTTLVTGGCGYVGRHLCLQLLALGHHLVVVDDLSSGLHPDIWLKDAISERRTEGGRIVYRLGHKPHAQALTLTLIPSDVRRGMHHVLGAGTLPFLEAIFHLAGPKMSAAHLEREPLTAGTKMAIDGSFFAWAEAHKARIARIVYVSPKDFDQAGTAVQAAANAGEALARLLAGSSKVATACVRLCSLYGKDQSISAWLPTLAQQVLRAGDMLAAPPAAQTPRHLLHIDDAVQALLLASEYVQDGVPVTLAAQPPVTALQVVRALARLRERPLTVQPPQQTSNVAADTAAEEAVQQGLSAIRFVPKMQLDANLAQVMRQALRREQKASQQATSAGLQPAAVQPRDQPQL